MRLQLGIGLAAAFTVMAPATAVAQNQAPAAAQQKAERSKDEPKAAQEKVCKRLPQGKVCMTREKWRQYEQML